MVYTGAESEWPRPRNMELGHPVSVFPCGSTSKGFFYGSRTKKVINQSDFKINWWVYQGSRLQPGRRTVADTILHLAIGGERSFANTFQRFVSVYQDVGSDAELGNEWLWRESKMPQRNCSRLWSAVDSPPLFTFLTGCQPAWMASSQGFSLPRIKMKNYLGNLVCLLAQTLINSKEEYKRNQYITSITKIHSLRTNNIGSSISQ